VVGGGLLPGGRAAASNRQRDQNLTPDEGTSVGMEGSYLGDLQTAKP